MGGGQHTAAHTTTNTHATRDLFVLDVRDQNRVGALPLGAHLGFERHHRGVELRGQPVKGPLSWSGRTKVMSNGNRKQMKTCVRAQVPGQVF